MLQTSTFDLLIALAMILFLYSIIDHRNGLYANIATSFLSGLMFAYLSSVSSLGAVQFGITLSLGSLLGFASMVAFVYSMLMVYEVIDEQFQKKKFNEGGEEP